MPEDNEYLEAGLFAVDRDARTVRGVLIPWGERSRLTVSKTKPLTFHRGDVAIPRDVSVVGLNKLHSRYDPMGHAVELETSDIGLVACFRIADTPEGDEWLADHGTLTRLSPEVRNIRRYHDGSATAELTGSALVDEGAFQSAGLFAIDNPTTPDPDPGPDTEPIQTPPATTPAGDPPATPDPTERNDTVGTPASVPNTFAPGEADPDTAALSAGAMFRAMAAITNGNATVELVERMRASWGASVGEAGMFALNDVKYDGTGGLALGASGANGMTRPAWLGEVLDGTEYVPRFTSLFGHKDLTALLMSGWKWTTKPKGGAWAGNKAAIPTNTPVLALVSEPASRWAGGHDHAREHVDFGTPGYFEAYYAAMAEDYFRWLDETVVLAEALAASTELEADNPSGLTIGAGMSALVDGAVAVSDAGLIPTFAVLPSAAYKSILKTPESAVLGYLEAALRLDNGTLNDAGFVIRSGGTLVTNTLVGARSAADVYELPGSPIRAEALNIANGGVDTGSFGYGGLFVKNAAGIVEVTPYTP